MCLSAIQSGIFWLYSFSSPLAGYATFPLCIHPLPQFLTTFKKRQFLGFHFGWFTSFRIPPGIRLVFLDIEGTQSTDFDPVTLCECGAVISLKKRSTTAVASDVVSRVSFLKVAMRSSLFM